MATLQITEYDGALGANGHAQIAVEPAKTTQNVTYTTATDSAAFGGHTKIVRLIADATAHVEFGADPANATANSQRLVANTEYWRGVVPGQKLSVYDGAS